MKQYSCKEIRNIALAGHGNSGKTSLVEALLFKAGHTDRLGRVLDGNTVCDYDPEEIKRRASINTSLAYAQWSNTKINLVDTPGLFDFAGGMYEGIRAAESVLITVSGKSGVGVGAIKAFEAADKAKRAKLVVVTKLDEEHADFYKVLEGLKSEFGPSICPIVVPFVKDHKVECYINLMEMKAYTYDAKGNPSEVAMPDLEHRLEGLVAAMSEAIAETDEELLEKFILGEQFTHEEMERGLNAGILSGEITPTVCCSSSTLAGINLVLDIIVGLMPSPNQANPEIGVDNTGKEVSVACDENAPLCAFVFKTIADPFVGKMSYIKVLSGKLGGDADPINASTGLPERLGKLVVVRGKKSEDVATANAGDIVVATKLSANTSDTLCDASRVVKLPAIEFPQPCYSMSVRAKGKGDESKISQGLTRLLEEDLTLRYEIDSESHEQILSGLGDQHLDVAVAKLKGKFGVEVELDIPTINYRETIRKAVKVEGKHKKQTGGHGQFGHVWIEFEPCDSDGLVFEEKVFGGSVPRNFFPAVEKGLQEATKRGVLAGYPVVGLKARLVDGSYHPVDSSEMAFKLAAANAYREGLKKATPIILEPIGKLKVVVTDANTGDMMGDLNKRRGRVLGMNPAGKGLTEIEADVPMGEMQDFTMTVRQMTRGMGYFSLAFERYEPLPQNLEADVIAKAKNKSEEIE